MPIEDASSEKLLKEVNKSGFPLQMRIDHDVRNRPESLGAGRRWQVIKTEVPWRDERNRDEGFVDLLVSNDIVCFVIECKRRTGGNWTFLVPPDQKSRRHMRFCITGLGRDLDCVDCGFFDPPSPEAEHCVVPGSNSGERSLDRIASRLVRATECLAGDFQQMDRGGAAIEKIAFVPLILSVPKPAVAHVDPAAISIADGTLIPETAIETVDFVRFRKAFSASSILDDPGPHETLRNVFEDRERSVLVMHAEHFSAYLDGLWHLDRGGSPWDSLCPRQS